MKILKFLFILFFIFNINNAALAKSNDKLELKISKNLRCLICQGQSIYDSQSDFAVSMKLLINKKINEGLNEKEIYDLLIEKYGEWIVYDTSLNKNTFILWGLPVLLFLIGGAIILKKLVFRKV
jgi:cytochrome c-type biogenesis protein CcmH|tara:strand:- start:539 stop:910 length:372 start_codon:yes stop_codon:yes gene_type:complete